MQIIFSFKGFSSGIIMPSMIISLCFLFESCSSRDKYDEAMAFIKQKKYAEAIEILKKISVEGSEQHRASKALLLCEAGNLYLVNNYEHALSKIDSTGLQDGRRYYLLNISPEDPLYPHATTLAHLVAGEMVLRDVNEYIDEYEEHPEYYGEDSEMRSIWEKNIRYGVDGAVYREYDYIEEGLQSDPLPFITSLGLRNLPMLPEWEKEVKYMQERFDKLDKRKAIIQARRDEAVEAAGGEDL